MQSGFWKANGGMKRRTKLGVIRTFLELWFHHSLTGNILVHYMTYHSIHLFLRKRLIIVLVIQVVFNELMRWYLIHSFIRRLLSILFCARLLGNRNQKALGLMEIKLVATKGERGEGGRGWELGLVDANYSV